MKILINVIVVIALQLPIVLFAQNSAKKRIVAYFSSGVTRNVAVKSQAVISSVRISDLLARHEINIADIKPAFPEFDESDTVDLSVGEDSRQMNRAKIFVITTRSRAARLKIIAELDEMPEVLFAEADGEISFGFLPNDTRFNQQWNMRNTINLNADSHAEEAWDIYTGSPNSIIAIVDNGVDHNHDDLRAKILGGTSGFKITTDELGRQFSHGSHLAGIAAASSNNGSGVAGMDWQAKIHPRQITDVNGTDAGINQAIIDAVDYGPNVWTLNHSWGLTDGWDEWNIPIPGRYSTSVRQAFAYAYRNNRVSCVAMGNHQIVPRGPSNRYRDVVAFPAGFNSGLIAVGGTTNNDDVANFSANGPHIDVAAPGVAIWSTNFNHGYIDLSGTLMAAPHVSGLASLLKGFNPSLANDDIEQIIRLSADDDNINPGFDNARGTGRINAQQALRLLQNNQLYQWSFTGGNTFSTGQQKSGHF